VKFRGEFITRINDVTSFVHEQYNHVRENRLDLLQCPAERVYVPMSEELCRHILLDGFDMNVICKQKEVTVPVSCLLDNDLEKQGACAAPTEATHITYNNYLSLERPEKTNDIVVSLGGAFNPVHTRHVQALRVAVDWLEKHTEFRVVDARLAPAPQGYVNSKCRKHREKCIKEEHRLKLCQLACADESVVKSFPRTVGSAQDCCQRVIKDAGLRDARVSVIIGADRAIMSNGHRKWNTKATKDKVTICVGRNGQTEAVRKAFLEDINLDVVKNKDFFIVDEELDNVSSSAIRRQLLKIEIQKEGSKEAVIRQLIGSGDLTESVGLYLLQNFDDLYE